MSSFDTTVISHMQIQIFKDNMGRLHNSQSPAVIDETTQEWYLFGLPHRTDGPAKVFFNENGEVQKYFLAGLQISPSKYCKLSSKYFPSGSPEPKSFEMLDEIRMKIFQSEVLD